MLTRTTLLSLPLLLAATAHAQGYGNSGTSTSSASMSTSTGSSYDVDVGNGGLIFSPETLTASLGDTITFHWYPRNHSLVQSSFDAPCVPLGGSGDDAEPIYSGFYPVAEGMAESMFRITVNSTDPIWLYCSQGQHCQGGMAMVINPPADGPNTLEAYKTASEGVAMAITPEGEVVGGVVLANEEGEAETEEDGEPTATATTSETAAAATGAAGVVRPAAGAVAVGLLAIGLGLGALL